MRDEYEKKLEELIQQQLNQLPELDAPPTLVPRVLRAIEARRHLAWWRMSLFNWPRPIQAMALGTFTLLPAIMFLSAPWLWVRASGSAASSDILARWLGLFASMGETFQALSNALVIILNSSNQWWIWAGVAVAALMYLSCIGLGTACVQIALRKR